MAEGTQVGNACLVSLGTENSGTPRYAVPTCPITHLKPSLPPGKVQLLGRISKALGPWAWPVLRTWLFWGHHPKCASECSTLLACSSSSSLPRLGHLWVGTPPLVTLLPVGQWPPAGGAGAFNNLAHFGSPP